MDLKTSKVFDDILRAWRDGDRRILLEGGTSSTKTYSAIQALIVIAMKLEKPKLISCVSESMPHMKRGVIRDFFNILDESPDNNPYYSKTEFMYARPEWNGTFEFFGADDHSKTRGPRRNILYINEANNIQWEAARNMDVRTSDFTILDWNPVGEFWAHEYWLDTPGVAYSHSTYLDAVEAGVLPEQTVKDIESYKDKDPNWWNVYGLGLVGKIEGLVFPHFEQVDTLPDGFTVYGLDFGFNTDPSVLVRNVIIGDSVYSQEIFRQSGLTNQQIAQKMTLEKIDSSTPIYADPNEPKSIEEIRLCGFNVQEAVKGSGSKAFGIQRCNQFYQYWTRDSVDCIKEQRNYRYIRRMVNGIEQYTDDTTHQWSHGMDARRYALATFRQAVGSKPRSKRSVAV
jgi:phage terminase large subunit